MKLAIALLLSVAADTAAPPLEITVTIGTSRVARTSDTFRQTGVNLDFWPASKDKWGTAGALTLDLNTPDLNVLAQGLNGSMLRLGGSPADFLLYDVSPDACSAANLNKTQETLPNKYFCPIWLQAPGQCLTMARWEQLLAFAKRTGLKLTLDLNACWGRPNSSADMDWSQIDGLLNYTAGGAATWASSLWGLEFGNELYSNVAAGVYGASVSRLAARVKSLWGAQSIVPPVIIGPDDWDADVPASWWKGMLEAVRVTIRWR